MDSEAVQLLEAGFQKSRAQTEAAPKQLLEKAAPKQLLEKAAPKQNIILKSKSKTSKINEEDIPIITDDKLTKAISLEEQFEFNEETINFFTKDLDPRKILIKHPSHSTYLDKINDTIIICLLIKIGHFKNYHCNTSKCKVGKLWNGKPIQLILNRKNSIQNDLSISNLDLICANCYMITYGLDIFIKKKKEIILTCTFCNFPLVNFKDSRKKKGICLSCEKHGNKFLFESQENNYLKELKETYSDNPVLNDNIKNTIHTNHYNEIPIYKKLDSKQNSSSLINSKNIVKPPIIDLNMNMPDLSDLIIED